MVHGNAVFIREEAKPARNIHRYTFSMRNFTPLTSLSIKQTILLAARMNYSRDYDVTLGALPIKGGT